MVVGTVRLLGLSMFELFWPWFGVFGGQQLELELGYAATQETYDYHGLRSIAFSRIFV